MAVSIARAKSLCNTAELKLLRASTKSEISKLSASQLKQKVSRARTLRDKWNDQARKQRRTAQSAQRTRQAEGNARSLEKAALFTDALTRFETQLAKLESKGKVAGPRIKKMSPRTRSATHRADRAEIRDVLKEKKLILKTKKKTAAKPKPTKPAPVAVFPEPTETDGHEAHATPLTPPARTAKGKKSHAGAGMSAIESARALQGLHVSKGQQLRARTAAKQTRLRASGIVRIQKNASAVNKRRQAKRDSR
jgi:hypothetical protein